MLRIIIIHKMEFAKCVCMGSCDVLALYFRQDEQIMNIEEQVLHQSNIPASNFVVYSIFLN